MIQIEVETTSQTGFVDITGNVQRAVRESGIKDGVCFVYVPHTTAAMTINENADPNVQQDLLMAINKLIPFRDNYSHIEGNSAAHIKSSLVGPTISVLVEGGRLLLGTWQGIFFCEFDGPRNRRVWVKILPS
jgi:secondary thiamine-phosphate synthase enzyme